MATVSSTEAFRYALSSDMLALYAMYFVGYLLIAAGTWLIVNWGWRGGLGNVAELLGLLCYLGGFLVIVGATIGVAFKVITDANSRATGT